MKLDDKIAELKPNLAGLTEFSDKGGIYAVPLTIQGFVVYSIKKLSTEAGLDLNATPETGNDLTKVCTALLAMGKMPCIALGNKEGYAPGLH